MAITIIECCDCRLIFASDGLKQFDVVNLCLFRLQAAQSGLSRNVRALRANGIARGEDWSAVPGLRNAFTSRLMRNMPFSSQLRINTDVDTGSAGVPACLFR